MPLSRRKNLKLKAKQFEALNGLLFKTVKRAFGLPGRRARAPNSSISPVIEAYHSHPGHFATSKTLQRLTEKRGFPHMLGKAQAHCRSCHQRSAKKHPHRKQSAKMTPALAAHPLHKAAGDIYGPLPASNGRKHAIAFIDDLARWPEAKAIPKKSAKEAAKAFAELIALRHGAPTLLLSDSGSDFNNQLLSSIFKQLGADKAISAPRHPQSHGIIERCKIG